MKILVAGFFALASSVSFSHVERSNPFAQYLKDTPSTNASFYPQTPPFRYPFERSLKVKNNDLNLEQFLNDYPENTLDYVDSFYKGFTFYPAISQYAYPFPLHPNWEFLPYPFVNKLPPTKNSQWISHFARSLKQGEGVNSFRFQIELDYLTGTKAFGGNELKQLKTPDSYNEILKRLSAVKDHAFISSFLFNCDKGTDKLVKIIGQKASEGAKIFIIYDKFGAKSDPSCTKKLKVLGANVLEFKTKVGTIFHEKMFVFDGEYALIDGQNIIAAGALSNGTNNLFNDISVGVKGPIVSETGKRFISLWERQGSVIPQSIKAFYQKNNSAFASESYLKESISKGKGVCRLVFKEPGKTEKQISNLFLHTVKNSKNYLFFNYIDANYNKPGSTNISEQFIDAVITQTNKFPDLRVDMLTNSWKNPFQYELPKGIPAPKNFVTSLFLWIQDITTKDDHKKMARMHANLIPRLNTKNFHWRSYAQYMHAKTLMSDNIWTIIGSYNLNKASEVKSYEMVLACLDKDLAQEMQKSIIIDSLNSITIPLE